MRCVESRNFADVRELLRKINSDDWQVETFFFIGSQQCLLQPVGLRLNRIEKDAFQALTIDDPHLPRIDTTAIGGREHFCRRASCGMKIRKQAERCRRTINSLL